MQFVRRRRSVRESSEKQKKELKKTLDTVGVVRDSAFTRHVDDPASPFAQKSLSINLDTHVREEQHHVEVSPFAARLPLGSPWAVSLIAKLRFERQEGSTS